MSLSLKNIPRHVAIIPDGNRRWARQKGLQPWLGHRQGVKTFEKVLDKALELEIPYLTLWGSSWDNLTKRSKIEINFFFKLYKEQFNRIAGDKRVHENKVKISVLGRWPEILPRDVQASVEKALASTKNYNEHFLTFLLAYDGTTEMIAAIQKIADSARTKVFKISGKDIKENLWTKDLPPVDLLIRTGCQNDPHFSAGFMMWDTTYAQLYFTKTFLPNFGPGEFEQIVRDYSGRERRFGK